MADEAKTILTIDPGPALAALDQVRASVAGMQSDYNKLNRSGDSLFDAAGASTQDFISDVDELAATMTKAQAAMRNLAQYEKFLEAQQKKTTDPALIKRYSDELAKTRRAMAELRATGVDAWDSVGKSQTKSLSIFNSLKGVVAGAIPVLSLSAVAASAIKAAAAYEQTRASFETFLKSADKADKLLSKLNTFSAKTPFSSDQVNAAAKSLLAFGESENTVITRLEQIGTISAATGKDFNELTTIYGKARTAGVLYAEDINQLVEAGIPIIEEFAKQMGVNESQVKKLASQGKIGFGQLQTAFQNLTSEGGKFAGLLEKQSNTAAGVASTLADVFGQRLRQQFSGFLEILKDLGKGLISIFDTTKSGSQVLEDERIAFLGVSNQIRLANEGSETRVSLIKDLKTQYPEFLGQIDAEKATNEDLQPILDKINQSYVIRIALQKQQEKLKPLLEAQAEAENKLAKQQVSVNEQLAKAAEVAGVNLSVYKTQEEQVKAVTAALEEQAVFSKGQGQFATATPINEQAKALEALKASQLGVFVQTNRQGQEQKKVNDAVEEQQKIVEQLKKTYGEVFDIAVNIGKENNKGTGKTPGGTTVSDAEAKKALEDEKKRQQLRLDLITNGRQKELAAEQLRTESNLAELKKYFAGRSELNDLLAQEQEKHRQNVVEINKKYDAEELLELTRAQNEQNALRQSLIEDGTKKEIEAEKARFEKVTAELKKQFAGSAELPALLEQAEAQHIAKLNQINEEGLTKILEGEKAANEQEIALIDAQSKKVILLMRQRGASEEDIAEAQRQFDLIIQKKRLEAELKFQEALLLAVSDGDEKRKQEIQNQIALLKKEIENIDLEFNLPEPKAKGGKKFDLAKLLGLTDEDAQAIQQAAASIIDSISQITQAKLAAAEQELQAADEKVQQAQDDLDTELKLAEDGFASNVSLKQKELEEAKKQQQAALAEKKKAQKQQAAIETVQQTISLITAAAQIFNSLAALPFGAGVPIAIAVIAAMFAAFAKVKIDAARSAKFREGGQGRITDTGVVIGPSHSSGGVPLEVEGGEFMTSDGKRFAVVKKHLTDKHFDLLDAINRDNTPAILEAAASLASGSSIRLKKETGANFEAKRTGSEIARKTAEIEELRKSNTLLKENNEYLKRIASTKSATTYFNGGRREQTGGLTKIIRERK